MGNNNKTNPDDYPESLKMDIRKRNENIDENKELCKKCDGTGNQLFSRYQKCSDCNGTGIKT